MSLALIKVVDFGRRLCVPIVRCEHCREDRPADHLCPAMENTLRRELHAIADQIFPEDGTTPDAPGAADDADMKGLRHD